ncbi:MAG: hypothetical protein MJZ19_01200 [Paludibacteraceae bacterium]|nr:hypothetical protein [Paludibacteraceae bacterium]
MEKKLKRHWTRSAEGFSYFKRLRHKQHTHYAQEFLDIMPKGIYDNKRPMLQGLVANELANLDNCRKNETREKWNGKVNELRAKMHAIFIILRKAAKLEKEGAERELHSYDMRVKGVTAQHEFVEGVRAFIGAWSGIEDAVADSMVEDATSIVEEIETLVTFMEMEDLMIANIPNQYLLREPTDELIFSIIAKAQVEEYELSPTIESEVERLEQITEFLNAIDNWLKRVAIANKNSGSDDEEPEPEPELLAV